MRKFKFRFIYKVLIVVAVFIAALVFFSSGIKENFFSSAAQTVAMQKPTLPTVSIDVDGTEVNLLHGYVSNLDEMVMRENMTPLKQDRTFTLLIHENESNVRKLKYEILSESGKEIENDSFTVLDAEDGIKRVKIAIRETLKSGKEYVAKFTLITNESKRIYYYTRLKMYDEGHLEEKLEFVEDFHRILLSGTQTEREGLKKYLETSKDADNTTFAHVSIKSSFKMIMWNELEPKVIWEEIPHITEFYEQMASIELKSVVEVETDDGTERYLVREDFRINYSPTKMTLYNYDRYMEALYDVDNTSLMKDEFKLGITNDTEVQTGASDNHENLAFVYGGGLYVYTPADNILTCAFSFRADTTDYARDLYDQYNIRLVHMHDNGDVDFFVYGYFNRGEYEGRVGAVLYRYVGSEHRIEEKLYVPVNSSYQLLKADLTKFAYLNDKDVFYFSIYDAIYSYDMIVKKLELIATDVPVKNLLYCENEKYLAWQDSSRLLEAEKIRVLDLESGQMHDINALPGENIRLYGNIDNNIIYGFSRKEDVCILADGSIELPSYELRIEDGNSNVLKTYRESGLYFDSISVDRNMITINRLSRKAGDKVEYVPAQPDSIMNRLTEVKKPVSVTKRVTDRILTEYYVSIPSGIDIVETPKSVEAEGTIINYDTTVRVQPPEDKKGLYYTYSYGKVVFASDDSAAAIREADRCVGTVINRFGGIVWERGVKAARSEIKNINPVYTDESHDSVQAALKMVLNYMNIDAETTDFSCTRSTVYDWLGSTIRSVPVNLSGASLDEVLYYVYKSRPVIGFRKDGSACVLVGYDAVSVTVCDPAKKKNIRYSVKEAVEMFEEGGNLFVSYVD